MLHAAILHPPQVLDALSEIAFNPDMLVSRLDKERKAVLAEAQMMNTIEYRVDCQLLQYLHEENLLGYRFPIGKTDQVIMRLTVPSNSCSTPIWCKKTAWSWSLGTEGLQCANTDSTKCWSR